MCCCVVERSSKNVSLTMPNVRQVLTVSLVCLCMQSAQKTALCIYFVTLGSIPLQILMDDACVLLVVIGGLLRGFSVLFFYLYSGFNNTCSDLYSDSQPYTVHFVSSELNSWQDCSQDQNKLS